jgi:hypothetical protein
LLLLQFYELLTKGRKGPKQNSGLLLDLSVKQPCLHPVFGPPFTPYPLFQWYLQSKDIFIKSQYEMLPGRRLILVFVQLGAVKIYATAVEALREKKERQDETQFTTNIDGFLSFIPS